MMSENLKYTCNADEFYKRTKANVSEKSFLKSENRSTLSLSLLMQDYAVKMDVENGASRCEKVKSAEY